MQIAQVTDQIWVGGLSGHVCDGFDRFNHVVMVGYTPSDAVLTQIVDGSTIRSMAYFGLVDPTWAHELTDSWMSTFGNAVHSVEAAVRFGKVVLVGCREGLNRSCAVAAAVICKMEGLPVDEVIAKLRASRPGSLYNPIIVDALVKFVEDR